MFEVSGVKDILQGGASPQELIDALQASIDKATAEIEAENTKSSLLESLREEAVVAFAEYAQELGIIENAEDAEFFCEMFESELQRLEQMLPLMKQAKKTAAAVKKEEPKPERPTAVKLTDEQAQKMLSDFLKAIK
jgi:hypothetical protein